MKKENNWFNRQSINHPVLVCFILLIIALIFRIIDIFVLRLDERLGEIILSKSLGFILVVVYLYLAGKTISYIGLHRQKASQAFFIGGVGMIAIFVASCGIQLAYLNLISQKATLALSAADLYSGTTGSSVWFVLLLLIGNFINSFMEEGLFRGLMLRHFKIRYSFLKANLLQATFFAAWHLVQPIKHYQSGQTDLIGALMESVVIFISSGIIGLVFGYLYLKTNSLWAPWIAHTINNTVLNFVYIKMDGNLYPLLSISKQEFIVLVAVYFIGLFLFILWAKFFTARFRMPQVKPWNN
ncbi:MAG: CPBP family intramembrane metalloprotease [Candidatus Atribacteria bacterium]|nr:MAG: CPBP family intramembrane metalloprotease [Candidatus Atribacteria bacterium]